MSAVRMARSIDKVAWTALSKIDKAKNEAGKFDPTGLPDNPAKFRQFVDEALASVAAPASDNPDGYATAVAGAVTFNASEKGTWANGLVVKIDRKEITDELATRFGTPKDKLFNLAVQIPGAPKPTTIERMKR